MDHFNAEYSQVSIKWLSIYFLLCLMSKSRLLVTTSV